MKKRFFKWILLGGLLLSLMGCSMSWESGLFVPETVPEEEKAVALVQDANEKMAVADSREKVEEVIALYKEAVRLNPRYREALAELSHLLILMGTGYSEDTGDKEKYFREAIWYSERSMVLNPEFKARVDEGVAPWEAADLLTAADADAMGWWATSVLYYFRECIPVPFMIFNHKWVSRAAVFMNRIDVVDPNWNHGGNLFNLGIYYIALPESAGGDLQKAKEYLERARLAGPERLLIPWGTAKYYHYRVEDQPSFQQELEWVLQQDPKIAPNDPYPWNLYFQRESRKMLENIDDYF